MLIGTVTRPLRRNTPRHVGTPFGPPPRVMTTMDRFFRGDIVGGRFSILGTLGHGGMATAFRVWDIDARRENALKTALNIDGNINGPALKAEAEVLRQLAGVSQVPQYIADGTTDDGYVYLAMEMARGKSLLAELHNCENERIAPTSAFVISSRILTGLAGVHGRGFIHGDLQPANVHVDADLGQFGSGSLIPSSAVTLLDFGIGGMYHEKLVEPGLTAGTFSYMSPEQARGSVPDGRSDIYSLGVVMYKMITGQNPFKRNTDAETLMAQILKPLPEHSRISGRVREIIHKAVEKGAEDRYQRATAMLSDVDDYLQVSSVAAYL